MKHHETSKQIIASRLSKWGPPSPSRLPTCPNFRVSVHGLQPYSYISCTQGMGPDDNSRLHQILELW
ncbi:hypothetical protein AB3S75_000508 [Citrus x aurantiifolia]